MMFVSGFIVLVVALMHCNCQTTTLTPAVADVIEGRDVTLVCKVKVTTAYTTWETRTAAGTALMGYQSGTCLVQGLINDTNKYSYACNSTVYQLTIHDVRQSQHNENWTCIAGGYSNGSTSIIKVKDSILEAPIGHVDDGDAYTALEEDTSQQSQDATDMILAEPPSANDITFNTLTLDRPSNDVPIASVKITPTTSPVDIEENHAKKFTCITSQGRPAGSVSWFKINKSGTKSKINQNTTETQTGDKNGLILTTGVLTFVPTRTQNGIKIYCEAGNTANSDTAKSSEKQLNVLYEAVGPIITEGSEYRVLENGLGQLHCLIKGGNPTPYLTWNCNNWSSNSSTVGETVTQTLSWATARGQDRSCMCTSQQSGFPDKSDSINVTILYSPSTPRFNVNGNTISGPIRFIEGKTRSIQCVTESNPAPQRYTWTKANSSPINGQNRTFSNVQRSDAGQYSCEVQNTMNPSSGGTIIGNNTSSVSLQVLYPPKIGHVSVMNIKEGTPLNKKYPFTPGNPPNITATWTRNIDNKTWNKEELTIQSVKRSDDATYTCKIYNVMEPTAAPTVSTEEAVTGTFHLNVQYKAMVKSLYVLGFETNIKVTTVNESYPLQFNCTVISNPLPSIQIRKGENTLNSSTGNMTLLYSGGKAMCQDAGNYTCHGSNKIYEGEEESKQLQVNVNCSPRSADVVNLNKTSEKNKKFTFVFNAIAYPVPVFMWKKWVDGVWKALKHDDNFRITSSGLQSNLTILRVGLEDFRKYLLVVANDFGVEEFHYQLAPDDEPDVPTDFRHVEHITTESSIQLEWKPGFNGGPPQTFYIRYKKSSSSTWNDVSVNDTREQTMQYMLTGLESDTQYQVMIYSSNRKGNSSESEPLIAKTKAKDTGPRIGPLVGGAVGGGVGCAILVIIAIFILRRYRFSTGKHGSDTELKRRSISEDSDDEGGMRDNPMYGTSTVAAVAGSSGTDNIYSKPQKPKKPKAGNVTGNGDIYAVVNKPKKNDKKKQKKEKASGNDKSQTGDVYENVEPKKDQRKGDTTYANPDEIASSKQPKKKNVNNDGLIYADLAFNDQQKGQKKLVIIGSDDRTPYAQVDFTKKADPLPESDEENA